MSSSSSASPAQDAERSSGQSPYDRALEFIFGRINYERIPHDSYTVEDFKLRRMQHLLAELGNPQDRVPAVHIAGTKGKGSTAAMLAAMLQASDVRTGLFTSPHLLHYEERMTVNGRPPSPQELVALVERVRPIADAMDRTFPESGPTFFEVTTALAWLYFESQQAEMVVLEVGLGGRLDSTNICRPRCTIITSISRDHMRLLGESLGEIAAEKAGIIKPGVPVVSGVEGQEPAIVIEQVARRVGAPLLRLAEELPLEITEAGAATTELPAYRVSLTTPSGQARELTAPLPGRHQARNLALAAVAFDLLSNSWRPLRTEAIAEGLRQVRWPLRIQQVAERPRVILDTAHNDASIRALCETVAHLPDQRRVLIFGTSRDKDVRAMLSILDGQFDDVILTRYVKNPRALPLDQLTDVAGEELSGPTWVETDPAAAWRKARALAGPADLICVTGSLFLAAEFQSLLSEAGR